MDDKTEVKNELETHPVEAFEAEIEHEGNDIKKGTLLGRRAKDMEYRHRLFHTACVFISMFALGWRSALIGPTFPDLRLIIDEDLSTASWIFTAKSLGGLLGSVCAGFAYDHFNKVAVFISIVLGMGVVAAITPWCFHFAAMLVVHVFHGVFAAAVDTAGTADMVVVWKQNAGPFMQAVHFAYSAGAIVSPLISQPFLAERINVDSQYDSVLSNSSTVTSIYQKVTTSPLDVRDIPTQPGIYVNTTLVKYGKTQIYVPYSITSLVCLVSACLYLLVSFAYGNIYKVSLKEFSKRETDMSKIRYFLGKKMKVIFTILLALVLLFYVVSEHCFIGFLMTFIISELKWSKARGSTASSVFWIAFAIGRLSGVIIVKFVNISTMIVTFFSILMSGAVLLLLAVVFGKDILVWVSIVIVGYGMSAIFGLVFSWLSQNVRTLTGKMTSIFFVFMCVGNMAIPLLVGHLMDKISQMWFIYSLLTLSVVMFACFIFALVVFNLLKKVHEQSSKSKTLITVHDTEG
ncbi:sodium-dependent glucose transporter 1A-like [Mercenaria mercenaria]|uniref:sodium-dependent glucose transporter 1A-like n=1 Tax=Mercenaria mercenaria TaxID=6596 RepID=UPI001E1DD317|nr:sodium-dependent glucose transporter 1A-like [Mercenaria mercenaria]